MIKEKKNGKEKSVLYILIAGALSFSICESECRKKNLNDEKSEYMTEMQEEITIDIGEDVEKAVLSDRLGIPNSCNINIDVDSSVFESIQIIDDEIEFPQTYDMSIVYYTTVTLDNNYKQTVAETIFDEGQDIYCGGQRIKTEVAQDLEFTKEEYENRLAED